MLEKQFGALQLILAGALIAAGEDVITYHNPIWSGFHPDPTCTFVPEWNNSFFCTTSSFLMFPGLPVYASRDLTEWKHVSNGFSRPEQLPSLAYLARGATSGIYAPTIRYRDGTFYILTTLAHQALPGENYTRWDNFIITSQDPFDSHSWSDPIHFDYPGIDPDPYWAEDGTVWLTGAVDGKHMPQAPIDLETGELTLPLRETWNGTGLPSPEAPHFYDKDGWVYSIIAEGGTRERHRVNVARARSIDGPWEQHPENPILTAYQNTESYFQAVGHADLFQDASGQWWAVLLANRAGGDYAQDPYNANFPMGRETVLTSVTWEDDWPVFQNITGTMRGPLPRAQHPLDRGEGHAVNSDDRIDFAPGSKLPPHLFHWRLPVPKNYQISPPGHENALELRSSRLNLTGFDGDSTRGWGQTFLARKQTHTRFRFSVDVDWQGNLSREDEEMGITALNDQSQHFDISVAMLRGSEGTVAPHIRFRGISTTPFRLPGRMRWIDDHFPLPPAWEQDRLRFQIEAVNTTHYAFSAGPATGEDDEGLEIFGYAKGDQLIPYYSGVVVGVYATSNGRYQEGAFAAHISRWRYLGLEQVIEQPE